MLWIAGERENLGIFVCACESANVILKTEAESHLERFFRVPMLRVYFAYYGDDKFLFQFSLS